MQQQPRTVHGDESGAAKQEHRGRARRTPRMVIPMPLYSPPTPSARRTVRRALIGPPATRAVPTSQILPWTWSLALIVSIGWHGMRARELAEALAASVGMIDGSGSGVGTMVGCTLVGTLQGWRARREPLMHASTARKLLPPSHSLGTRRRPWVVAACAGRPTVQLSARRVTHDA